MTVSASSSLVIRPVTPPDVSTVFALIKALAEYENLSHDVVGSETALSAHLFGDRPYIDAFLAWVKGQPAGFALFFNTYDSRLGAPGYYLEDLFVFPAYRGNGIGKALLAALAQHALNQRGTHLQWSVLDWNQPAIGFYQRIGAAVLDDYRIGRVRETELKQWAQSAQAPEGIRERFEDSNRAGSSGIAGVAYSSEPFQASPYRVSPLNRDRLLAQREALSQWAFSNPDLAFWVEQMETLALHVDSHPPIVEAVMVERDGEIVGLATFVHNYSTFLTQPGLFVESVAIAPNVDPRGPIEAIRKHLARLAMERRCGRLEWLVEAKSGQPQPDGATVLPDWRICRMGSEAMATLARQAMAVG